jgi:hypothetical protein
MWFWIKNKRLESQLRETQHRNVALATQTRDLEQQVKEAIQRLDQQTNALLALQQQPLVEPYAPGSITRKHGQPNLLKIASAKDLIGFQLRLEKSSYRHYAVTLETANGDRVLKANGLTAKADPSGGRAIEFLVPARLLQPRDYVISVNGMMDAKESEEIEAYNFRVSKK